MSDQESPTPPADGGTAEPPASEGRDRLDLYLKDFRGFFDAVGTQLTSAVGDAPEAVLVEQVASSLRDQVGSFVQFMQDELTATPLSAQTRDLLEVQRISELAQTAEVALRDSIARGFLGQSLWWWVDFIAELIKKLVDLLWPGAPPWVIGLLDIIDELLELLKGIFGASKGISPTEIHTAGASLRCNSYSEQIKMVNLQVARQMRRSTVPTADM